MSFVGVGLVSLGVGGASTGSLWGLLLALVAVSCFAVYSVAIVPVMSRHTPLVATAVTTLIGAVLLSVAACAGWSTRTGAWKALAWGSLVYSALPAIVLGNILWFTAISRVGPGRASLYPNLQPFLGAVFALLVLSEGLGALEIACGCVIATGLVIGRRRSLATPPAE